ncbi:DNA polymerase IV [Mesomycoplasma flocculare]|uniref:DNA polymerase IV n=1 Tax=Mesomycoplasma flocculare ATCC 27399 TaxID=743971 RepID=A0A0A8E5Y5_MESFC|nr:DNA polymerase IV [Mesomycoplasma flocculare]AJC49620.1 DNA polymerase IV [Mesomycoplasma flocculare ATCC 27399]ENX50833.1 DNA polymerase IV [Mesomycoplasma flocculare ATCC 27716]
MPKIIAHIDIDNFFVSSEIRLNPKLEGQPIVISRNENFAMAVSVSEKVKEKGFKITDKISDIKKNIPNLIVIKPNLRYYNFLSKQFFDYITKNFTKKIEIYSIDECFVDLTNFSRKFNTILEMLWFIKKKSIKNFVLPISISVSYNKLLAKMATNLAKNTKLRVMTLTKANVPKLICPQKIKNLFGIGIQIEQKLKDVGVFTVADLLKKGINNEKIVKILGINRHYFFQSLTRIGDDNVSDKLKKFKSLSHFSTFPIEILLTKKKILDVISNFLLDLVEKLKKYNKAVNRVEFVFKLKKNNIKDWIFSDISTPSNDYDFLYSNLVALVEKVENFSSIHGFGISPLKVSHYDKSMLKTNPKVKNIISSVNKSIGSKKLFVLNYLKN